MTDPIRPPALSTGKDFTGDAFSPLYTTTVTVDGGAVAHGRASGRARSSDGALDSTFGQAGVATLPFGSSTESVLMAPSSRAAVLVPTQSSYVIARVWR